MIQLKNKSELERMKKSLPDFRTGACGGRRAYPGGNDHLGAGSDPPPLYCQPGSKTVFFRLRRLPGTACISVNDEVIHGIPSSERVLREGDIVSVDVGACIDGFHGDNAFTFPVGQIREEAQKLLDVTQKSLYLGIEAAQAGHRVGDIGAAVKRWWSKTVLLLSASMWDMAWAITCMKIRDPQFRPGRAWCSAGSRHDDRHRTDGKPVWRRCARFG